MKKIYLFISVIICIFSCKKSDKGKEIITDRNWNLNINANVKQPLNKIVFTMANDSILKWQKYLSAWKGDTTKGETKLDSIVCLNNKQDKAIMTLLGRGLTNDNVLDALGYFYGVKIKGEWYFFAGPTQFVEKQNTSKTTSFHELHQFALQYIFSGYLKKKDKGWWKNMTEPIEWEINERFFDDLTSNAWYNAAEFVPKTQEDWDEIYLKIVNDNWKEKHNP
jgi:hypothetical protein